MSWKLEHTCIKKFLKAYMLKIKKNVCSFIATHLNAPYQNYINICHL